MSLSKRRLFPAAVKQPEFLRLSLPGEGKGFNNWNCTLKFEMQMELFYMQRRGGGAEEPISDPSV
jgi:hypothetical protein